MKRMSKAEEALYNQLKNITAQCDAASDEIRQTQVKLKTLDTIRWDLEDEIDRLKGIRISASERNKS